MKPSVFVSTVLCSLVALPAAAFAQDQVWLKDRRYTEGPGFRVGDFEIHPGAALEFGYDSNYLHRPEDDPSGQYPVLPSLRLMITPSLSFSTLSGQRNEASPATSPPTVDFRGGVSLTYNEFIPVSSTQSSLVSSQRNVSGNLDLQARLFPGRQWSGTLLAGVTRALTPGDDGQSVGFSSAGTFNRDVVRGGAEIGWAPGAGLFEWKVGYGFTGTVFESLSELTNLQNEIRTRMRWRFLPRTSLIFDGRFDFIDYTSPGAPATPTDPTLGGKTSSHPMRALLGVNGLVTQSFALLVMVGWGASFYATPPPPIAPSNFDSVIGQAELKWYITPNASADPAATSPTLSSVSVGFARDFYDSWIGTYFERDRGYASLSYFYGGKFLLVLDGGAAPLIYPAIPSLGVNSGFTDIRLDASLFGEYRFKDAFGVNATVRYNEEISNTALDLGPATPGSLSFREVEAYLGFRWLM
jgi:hypothetical protein